MKQVLFVLTILSAAGCKKQIDNGKAETSIKSGLEARAVKVESISCPSGRAAKKGDTFDCTGKAGGKDFTVTIEQQDDEGSVKWKLNGYILNTKEIIAESSAKGLKLSCADRPVTVESAPTTLDCELPEGKIKLVFAADGSMKAVPVEDGAKPTADEPTAGEPAHDNDKHDDDKHDDDKHE